MRPIKYTLVLSTLFFFISSHSYGQAERAILEKEHFELLWIVESRNRTNFEVCDCFSSWALSKGMNFMAFNITDSTGKAIIEGSFSHSYQLENFTVSVGDIEFDYQFQVKNQKIYCRFYNFNHTNVANETYATLGKIPMKWHENTNEVFSEEEYEEIKSKIIENTYLFVKVIDNYCVN